VKRLPIRPAGTHRRERGSVLRRGSRGARHWPMRLHRPDSTAHALLSLGDSSWAGRETDGRGVLGFRALDYRAVFQGRPFL